MIPRKTLHGEKPQTLIIYRSRHGRDTVIEHSLGGAVARSLDFKKECNNPYGKVQSKTFGAPAVPSNLGSRFGEFGTPISKNSILDLGVAGGVAIGAFADSVIGFLDGVVLSGLGADIGKQVATDMGNRLADDTNTNPDRILYFDDLLALLIPMLKQLSQALNSDGIIVLIVTLVHLFRMQCLSMRLNKTCQKPRQMTPKPK